MNKWLKYGLIAVGIFIGWKLLASGGIAAAAATVH